MKDLGWLTTLHQSGSVPYSHIPTRDQGIIEQLVLMQIVRVEAKPYQRRVLVTNIRALAQWLEAHFPPSQESTVSSWPRAQNIVRTRSSKKGISTHSIQPVLLRWFDTDNATEPVRCTERYGLFACTSKILSQLPFPPRWYLLFVENWESFIAFQNPECDATLVVVATGGQIADVTLHAISKLIPTPAKIVHFGDLDWSGLHIFRRIQTVLPTTRLYIPPHLDNLLSLYGNRDLLINQPPYNSMNFDALEMKVLVESISRANAGLEQEIMPAPGKADFN